MLIEPERRQFLWYFLYLCWDRPTYVVIGTFVAMDPHCALLVHRIQRMSRGKSARADQMNVVDLFSGCGGLSLGFQTAGFNVLKSYDNWSPAIKTYRKNFSHEIVESDLSKVGDLPSCDIIVGGSPCQGFSSAGRRCEKDERNSLVSVFAELVVKARPKAFVFENVEGFVTLDRGQFLFDLLSPLIEAGFCIHLRKVNVSNYGVPQHRKRVIAIGGLNWDPGFPAPTHSTFGAPGAHSLNRLELPRTPTFDKAMSGLPCALPQRGRSYTDPLDHFYTPFSEEDQARASALKQGQRMRDLPEELWHASYKNRAYRRVMDGTPTERRGGAPSGLRRLSGNEPSKAMTGGALRDFVHPHEDRPLTLRECARLQTFPDSFRFDGTMGEKCQQIGNAVPPRFSEVLAKHMLKALGTHHPSTNEGALLSFVPTNSTGKSPILQCVCTEVKERFLGQVVPEQGQLCL